MLHALRRVEAGNSRSFQPELRVPSAQMPNCKGQARGTKKLARRISLMFSTARGIVVKRIRLAWWRTIRNLAHNLDDIPHHITAGAAGNSAVRSAGEHSA